MILLILTTLWRESPCNAKCAGEETRELVPMQPGDVEVTYADSEALERDFGFRPSIDIRTGLRRFAEWYKSYYIDGNR